LDRTLQDFKECTDAKDSYSIGMWNAFELIQAHIKGEEPKYKEVPKMENKFITPLITITKKYDEEKYKHPSVEINGKEYHLVIYDDDVDKLKNKAESAINLIEFYESYIKNECIPRKYHKSEMEKLRNE
jgi:hypothetical protein